MDIGLKFGLGIAGALAAAGAIINPNSTQKDEMAKNLFGKEFKQCSNMEQRTAEFGAGRQRWEDFMKTKVYAITRKLPGSSTPLLDPYLGSTEEEDKAKK